LSGGEGVEKSEDNPTNDAIFYCPLPAGDVSLDKISEKNCASLLKMKFSLPRLASPVSTQNQKIFHHAAC
jgi:hypothetical protein